MAKRKKQLEISGAERPADEQLDRHVEKILEHAERRQLAKAAEDEERAEALGRMADLSLDEYTYFDGEEQYSVVRRHRDDSISVRKRKPMPVDEGGAV